MDIIKQKLDILYQQKIISTAHYSVLTAFVNNFATKVIKEKQEELDRMITHTSMFLNRYWQEKQLDTLDQGIVETITKQAHYQEANTFLETHILNPLKIKPTEAELNFLLMHVLNIFFEK